MKNKITLYLFLFTLLILIFQLVNSNKVLTAQGEQNLAGKEKIKQLKDSLQFFDLRIEDEVYFSLTQNEGAARFFPNRNLDSLQTVIESAVYDLNTQQEKNPLISYSGMNGTFFFNKVKILNHQWLIADFSDGTYWGEVLVHFKISPSGKITFSILDDLLYPVEN